jgi:hypothetical protein
LWLEEAGFEVVHVPVTPKPLPSIATRFAATIRSARAIRRQAQEFDVVVLHAMNAPHMVWLSRRLRRHGAVVLDLCDSLTLWSQAVPWRVDPFFRFKNLLAGWLVRVGRANPTCSYVTFRDAQTDKSAGICGSPIVILSTNPSGLDDLERYVGPPTRVVIPADLVASQNAEALGWFEDAVRMGELQLRVPVEVYGPVAPTRDLPDGVEYKGWAPRLRDIYEGQTAVFAPTVRGAGIQGKYLEAVVAGRPVAVGRQPAEAIPDYSGALPYASRQELIAQFHALQCFSAPLNPGAVALAPASELELGVTAVRAMAQNRPPSG